MHQYLDDIDIFAYILGALGHDLDHPGCNNMYMQKTGNILAKTYND